ncbi:beta-ketoacyl-[acyl-carrier-protein] synthase family protein [Actinomadura sp. ATCC 31491]|uniref:3-oxoacyl-[acyl-carrier-protein] synthase 2 n=1 Tax=Actinomadura luzonensis TaxID=2805427 RepID=A0ABT0G6W6_9ACTN|nr:beta-ketoacyl-[acyl-carrier-protein] synthase family protein [Actinomadura luzonensis]MCK2220343.1 beta-ketoacyl-[acyl-carrier-protein] synthase family protein [Actinomadura luzonensis]
MSPGAPGGGRARVAVTGLGVRTPAGAHPKDLWNALLAGRSTARRITSFDTEGLGAGFACQVPDLDVEAYLTPKQAARLDRVAQLAVCAAGDAMDDAGPVRTPPERQGVVTGSGFGGVATYEADLLDNRHLGRGNPGPLHVPMIMHNAMAAAISIRHRILGPSLSVTTACASGAHAIAEGARLIRDGSADLVIAGGAEASVTPTVLLAFDRCRALSRRNDAPERASRPFDRDRDGFVLAEGAAFVVLERLEAALARDARVYAELSGLGFSSDAHHITAPPEAGDGAARCMRAALADAALTPGEIAHVNAHGSGTPLNDLAEARAVGQVFGDVRVPVTSTKGVTGHAIGAAGAIEAVAAVLALNESAVPPTANLTTLDPQCDIDVVAEVRPMPPGPVMSNSFGFGGHNATLIFSPF